MKNGLSLNRNSELCGVLFLFSLFLLLPPQHHSILENQYPCFPSSCEKHPSGHNWRGQNGFSSSTKMPCHRELSLFDWRFSGKAHSQGLRSHSMGKALSPQHLLKMISCSCLILQMPETAILVWSKKIVWQKKKKKN